MYRYNIFCVLAAFMLVSFTACDKKENQSDTSSTATETADSASKGKSGALKDGQWPSSIYSKYGVDEISTKGKIVYTEFLPDEPYQYGVYYAGVTQDELKAWVDKLIAKGMRIHDRDKERVNKNSYDHDTVIYFAEEKQQYRIHLSFDFSKDMEFEYFEDEPNPAYTVTEKKDGDVVRNYIYYNLRISLNPINKDKEFKGSFDSLGLKAEDLKVNDHVISANMSENARGGVMNIRFYQDHFTTKEEHIACRDLIMDKLAEKGAKFSHAMTEKEMTAAELKEADISTYYAEVNGKKYLLMVDPDSKFDRFGGGYGVRLTLKQ